MVCKEARPLKQEGEGDLQGCKGWAQRALGELLAPGGQVERGVGEQHALAGHDAQHAHVDVELVAQLLRAQPARLGSP
jgi:hypothetical protein